MSLCGQYKFFYSLYTYIFGRFFLFPISFQSKMPCVWRIIHNLHVNDALCVTNHTQLACKWVPGKCRARLACQRQRVIFSDSWCTHTHISNTSLYPCLIDWNITSGNPVIKYRLLRTYSDKFTECLIDKIDTNIKAYIKGC